MRKNVQRHPARWNGPRATIDELEPRRLLTTFPGTDGPDTIVLNTVGTELHIIINGVDHVTFEQQVTVSAGNGNDTVRIGNLLEAATTQTVIVQLGSGTDLLTTHDSSTNSGSVNMDMNVVVEGDLSDTIWMDDSSGVPGSGSYSLEDDFFFDSGSIHRLRYFTIGFFEVTGTSGGDNFTLDNKPTTLHVTVSGGDGDDIFFVGGGNFESHGWSVNTTSVFGGAGNDSITFDDIGGQQPLPLTVAGFVISRGTWGCTYSSIETQTIRGGGGSDSNVLNIDGPSGFISTTTVDVSRGTVNLWSISPTTVVNGTPSLMNVAKGSLDSIGGHLTLAFTKGGVPAVTLNDQNSTSNNSYQVTSTQLSRNGLVFASYSGVSTMTLNAGSGSDGINVLGTPANLTLTINADPGNDNVIFGNGNIDADLAGAVTVNGGSGADSLTIDNRLDATSESETLGAFDFVDDGISYGFSGIDGTMTVNLGSGGNNLTVNALLTRTTITGGSGNDSFNVGGGDIDFCIPASGVVTDPFLVINGQTGADSILFDDRNDASNTIADNYQFQQTNGVDQLQRVAGIGTSVQSHFANWSGIENVTLEASSKDSLENVVDIATALRINANAGNDFVQVVDAHAPITINSGLGGQDKLVVNADNDGEAATAIIDQSDDIESLTVFAGATLRIATGATLLKTHVSNGPLTLAGTLDLAGGSLLSRAGGPTPATFRTLLTSGFNGGGWNGTNASGSINSSLAAASSARDSIGYGLGLQIAISTIGGFSIAPGDMLVRYTLDGDADLNGQVNLFDFNRLAANFAQAGREWVSGEFSYDGSVNLIDFNALAGNFSHSLTGPSLFSPRRISDLEKLL